jgi:hypothetical protein
MVDIENSEAPENGNSNWNKINLNTMEIKLDNENPRLKLYADATQEDIRQALFEEEEIIDLIDSITENGGLFPGENIIVLKTDDYYKVLEGNRRVCSLQCMINPELAPQKYRETVKNLITDFNIENLKNIEAEVAPSWEAAQKIITSRHTKYQIRRWSYISKWRRDYIEFSRTGSAKKVSEIFSEDPNQVIKNLNEYAFIRYILDMPTWNRDEIKKLSSNDLKGSLLEREMSPDIQKILGITIDTIKYDLHTSMEKEKFNYVLAKFTRSLFLGGQPNISTRTNKDDVKAYVYNWIKEYDESHVNTSKEKVQPETNKQGEATDTSKKEQHGKEQQTTSLKGKTPGAHSKYFRNLKVDKGLNDANLENVVYEISKIQVEKFPLATLLLTRTLIEKSLIYRMKEKNELWVDFMQAMSNWKNKDGKIIDRSTMYTLDDIINYCINNVSQLFTDKKDVILTKKTLINIQDKNGIRPYLNDMVHESFKTPSAEHVQLIADQIKILIQKILLKEE